MKKEYKVEGFKKFNSSMGFNDSDKTTMEIEIGEHIPMEEAMKIMKSHNIKLVVEENILDEQERKYLKEVIRPFRDRIDSISKSSLPFSDNCFIAVSIDDGDDDIFLPNFERNEMYLGMELDREYSLEELGL